ncbi:MAG: peptidoglycan recognition family protein [Candidatus Melainabacteria bacterium]|nr:peptidoglycan recognition family protein [Candidatus Melainabacteria bacterium]
MTGRCPSILRRFVLVLVLLVVAFGLSFDAPSEARRKSSSAKKPSHHSRSGSSHAKSSKSSGRSSSKRHGRHEVAHSRSRHHGGHHHPVRHHHHHVAHKPRYAYPIEMFMMRAPEFDASPLPEDKAREISHAFDRGLADKFPARTLVRAGIIKHHPLRGGIYWRREPIKYIVMHSTETGNPVSGIRVIESWSSMGRRHPGAQYVVDRDGSIIQAVDPDLATVHINILKTLPGINNDNCVGIEMNHTGSQNYPDDQLTSVIKLVTYLQDRYSIPSENIITHRYAQQGDHTDPVHFDWKKFLSSKDKHRNQAIAYKMNSMEKQSGNWGNYSEPAAASVDAMPGTYLQPQTVIKTTTVVETKTVQTKPAGSTGSAKPNLDPDDPKPPFVMIEETIIRSDGPNGQPPTVMMEDSKIVPDAVVKPVPPKVVKPAPPKQQYDAYGLPSLRGPIEVGPEHAGDLTSPNQ